MAPRGDKSAYTTKQKRQARHIEESAREEGRTPEAAQRIAWATVNKVDGGGKKKSGSARRGGSAKRTTKSSRSRRPKGASQK